MRDTYNSCMKLSEMAVGQTAEIVSIGTEKKLTARLQTLNVAVGKQVKLLRRAPFRGGCMLDAEGVRLALRESIAQRIDVVLTKDNGQKT